MVSSSSSTFPITYRADLDILVGRWMTEISLAAQVKQNYIQLFAAAAEAGNCRYWLLDARRRFRTTLEITNWVNSHIPQESLQQLGAEIRVAFLLAPHQLLASTESPPFPALRHPVLGHPMSAQFTDEGTAIAWLQTQQHAA